MTVLRRSSGGRVVALTGACGYLGAQVIRTLESDPGVVKIVALDVRRPPVPLAKTRYHRLDLTLPRAGGMMAGLLERENVDTFLHLAFLYDTTHRVEWAHELESVGTMHVLDACARAGVSQLIHWSTTLCYGARPNNPNRLTEDAPLIEMGAPAFILDKVDAERQVAAFARERPEISVAVLRTAPLLARGVQTLFVRYFSLPVAPLLAGHDPLMQFLDAEDAVGAFMAAFERRWRGVFNIAAPGALPLRTILALLGRSWLPIMGPAASLLSKALWAMQFTRFPPEIVDYLRYPVVADTSKARDKLGWSARYDLLSLLGRFRSVDEEGGRGRDPGKPAELSGR